MSQKQGAARKTATAKRPRPVSLDQLIEQPKKRALNLSAVLLPRRGRLEADLEEESTSGEEQGGQEEEEEEEEEEEDEEPISQPEPPKQRTARKTVSSNFMGKGNGKAKSLGKPSMFGKARKQVTSRVPLSRPPPPKPSKKAKMPVQRAKSKGSRDDVDSPPSHSEFERYPMVGASLRVDPPQLDEDEEEEEEEEEGGAPSTLILKRGAVVWVSYLVNGQQEDDFGLGRIIDMRFAPRNETDGVNDMPVADDTWVLVEWFYKPTDAEYFKKYESRLLPRMASEEVLKTNHRDIVSVSSIAGLADVWHFNEATNRLTYMKYENASPRKSLAGLNVDTGESSFNGPWSAGSEPSSFFWRIEAVKKGKEITIKPSSFDKHCLCEAPYLPWKPQIFCELCKLWIHSSCSLQKRPTSASNDDPDGPFESTAKGVPDDLLEVASRSIIRGGAYGLIGNQDIVLGARRIVREGTWEEEWEKLSRDVADFEEWQEYYDEEGRAQVMPFMEGDYIQMSKKKTTIMKSEKEKKVETGKDKIGDWWCPACQKRI